MDDDNDTEIFALERGGFDRVSRGDEDELGNIVLVGQNQYSNFRERLQRMGLTIEEYFMIRLKNDLKQLDYSFYDRFDMSFIRKSIQTIPYLMYKNPLTYALGFYCVHNNEINENRLDECESLCIREKKSIKRSDILRYARLIFSHI
jgi:hypothetical protein